jgi:hypothetical protein
VKICAQVWDSSIVADKMKAPARAHPLPSSGERMITVNQPIARQRLRIRLHLRRSV